MGLACPKHFFLRNTPMPNWKCVLDHFYPWNYLNFSECTYISQGNCEKQDFFSKCLTLSPYFLLVPRQVNWKKSLVRCQIWTSWTSRTGDFHTPGCRWHFQLVFLYPTNNCWSDINTIVQVFIQQNICKVCTFTDNMIMNYDHCLTFTLSGLNTVHVLHNILLAIIFCGPLIRIWFNITLTLSLLAVNFEDLWKPMQTIWIQMKPHKMWGFIWEQFGSRWSPTKCGASSEIQIIWHSDYISAKYLGGNNDLLHPLKEKKYLKKLPSMQRVNT